MSADCYLTQVTRNNEARIRLCGALDFCDDTDMSFAEVLELVLLHTDPSPNELMSEIRKHMSSRPEVAGRFYCGIRAANIDIETPMRH